MSKWIATVHAIGITKINGNIKVYAPYGLSDIYSRTIRPINIMEILKNYMIRK